MMNVKANIKRLAYMYLICIIAFSSTSSSAGTFQLIALAITKVAFALLALFFLIENFIEKKMEISYSILPLVLFGLYCVLSSFFTDYEYSISSLIFSIFTCLIFSQSFDSEEDIEMFFKTCVIGGYLLIAFLILKSGNISTLLKTISSNALSEILIQKNILAFLMAVVSVICFFYGSALRRKEYYFIMICPTLMLLATGSRRGIISFFIGIVLIMLLDGGGLKRYKNIFLAIIVILILKELLSLPIFSSMNARLTSLIDGISGNAAFSNSDESRFEMIQTGLNMFCNKPLFGYGAGAFKEIAGYGKYSHNNYVELLVNFGIFGFVMYYYVVFSQLKCAVLRIKYGARIEKLFITILIMRLVSDFGNVSYYDKFSLAVIGVIMCYFNKKVYVVEKDAENYGGGYLLDKWKKTFGDSYEKGILVFLFIDSAILPRKYRTGRECTIYG